MHGPLGGVHTYIEHLRKFSKFSDLQARLLASANVVLVDAVTFPPHPPDPPLRELGRGDDLINCAAKI